MGEAAGSTAIALKGWLAWLDYLGNSCNGPAGTHPGNQNVHSPLCVSPNLFSSGFTVDLRVCGVLKLIRHVSPFLGSEESPLPYRWHP